MSREQEETGIGCFEGKTGSPELGRRKALSVLREENSQVLTETDLTVSEPG